MKTLIVYSTKYGATRKCIEMLVENIAGNFTLINLEGFKQIDFSGYDKVIIGGPIYAGHIRSDIVKFCKDFLSDLKSKKIGLFITGLQRAGKKDENYIGSFFPDELSRIAIVKEIFGGEIIYKDLNLLDKFIIKNIIKSTNDVSMIFHHRILKFAEVMNKA